MVGKGVSYAAEYDDIIEDLFQNTKTRNLDGTQSKTYFSALELSLSQKQLLTYPAGFTPLDKFVYGQVDTYSSDDQLLSTITYIVLYATKNDGYIYGLYFDVTSQPRFDSKTLTKSRHPVTLLSSVNLVYDDYLEVYYDVNDTTMILSLSTETDNVYSSLQYRSGSKYIYNILTVNGVVDPDLPKTKLIGLSRNLR